MKKFVKNILIILMIFMPLFLNAETYGEAESKVKTIFNRNEYVNTYEKYLQPKANGIHGELISLDEYRSTIKKGTTYLFDGMEYYTRSKKNDNEVYIIRVQTNKELANNNLKYTNINGNTSEYTKYKTRGVVFVKPTTKVDSGSGTYKDPWTFASMYKVTGEVNDEKYGEIIDKKSKYLRAMCTDSDCTYLIRFEVKSNYMYLDNDCNSDVVVATKDGNTYKYFDEYKYNQDSLRVNDSDTKYTEYKNMFETVENESDIKTTDKNTVGIIRISKIRRNTTCHVYLGTGYFEIKVPGATPNKIYLRYGENYYRDKNIVIRQLDAVPQTPGYNYKGYSYKGITTIIDENKDIIQNTKRAIREDTTTIQSGSCTVENNVASCTMQVQYTKSTSYMNDYNTLFYLRINDGLTISDKKSEIRLVRNISSSSNYGSDILCTYSGDSNGSCKKEKSTDGCGTSWSASIGDNYSTSDYSRFVIKPQEVGDYTNNKRISYWTTSSTATLTFKVNMSSVTNKQLTLDAFTYNYGCTAKKSTKCGDGKWSINPNNGGDYDSSKCAWYKNNEEYWIYPQISHTQNYCQHFSATFK